MIRVCQIKLSILNDGEEALLTKISKILRINNENIISYKIDKRSIDSRNKNNILYVYNVDVNVKNEDKVLSKIDDINVRKVNEINYEVNITGEELLEYRPVIVGAGPAGLTLGYMLSKYGFKPIIIEKGKKVEERKEDVNRFWEEDILDESSNVQFGEGGAGTFSDGKLNTLVKDKFGRNKYVFELLIKMGAPKEIIYDSKPHVGTDNLEKVVINLRNEIINNGGEFLYSTSLEDITVDNNKLTKIITNNGEIVTNNIFLCVGNSARNTFKMLYENGVEMRTKPFAVGVRIMHDREFIDKMNHGKYYNLLPASTYKLTYNNDERSVYSFCMCPGGYVVNASSEKEKLVVNGMSNYKRDSKSSNSAIVVSVNENDYGHDLFDGVNFQRALEDKAYKLCNGRIPVQRYIDFKNNVASTDIGTVTPETKGKICLANIRDIFPDFIVNNLIEGIDSFSNQIEGFNMDDALLFGVETRTSSPVTILRNEEYESNIKGIYPVGEGAGYSGGITTSMMDALKVSEGFFKKYKGVK